MAVYCAQYKLLFIGNKRTGSTAVAQALIEQLGGQYRPPKRHRVDERTVISKRHSTVRQLVQYGLLEAPIDGLCKFCAVRNPFDSLVSLWTKLRHRPNRWSGRRVLLEEIEFLPWLKGRLGRAAPQSMHDEFTEGVDVVMRFETLEEDLMAVLARAGAPAVALPRSNPTTQRAADYRAYYDDEARALVERVFGGDLDKYGYAF